VVEPGGQEGAAGDQQLADHQRRHQQRDRPGLLDQQYRVELHAEGDEEEGGEEVAEGDDLGQDVAVELRLGDDQASQEGAQRQRQPGRLAGEGGAEGDDDHRHREELPRAEPGDGEEDRGHHLRSQHDHRRQGETGDRQRAEQLRRQVFAGAGEEGQQGEHRHQAQVLDHAQAERRPRLRARPLAPPEQQLEGDDRGGDGEGAAEQERRRPAPAEEPADRRPERDRQRDLEGAGDQGDPPHPLHLVERAFDADGEHQDGGAEVGQRLHAVEGGR